MAKVMLVEDDNNLREIYEARLAAEGYEIVSAPDGEAALALAIKEKPDLIISDIMMPKVSGFDMLDILRSTTETKHAKIIMMTALNQAEDKAKAEQLGADLYLVKSQVTLEDVVKSAQQLLGDQNPATVSGITIESPGIAAVPMPQPPTTSLTSNTQAAPVQAPPVSAPAPAVAAPQQITPAATPPMAQAQPAQPAPATTPSSMVTAPPSTVPSDPTITALPEDKPAGDQITVKNGAAAAAAGGSESYIDPSISGRKKVIKPISDVLTKGPNLNALLEEEKVTSPALQPSANTVISPNGVTVTPPQQDIMPAPSQSQSTPSAPTQIIPPQQSDKPSQDQGTPTQSEPSTIPAPSSTEQEEAALQAQIEQFISQTPAAPNASQPTQPVSQPVATPQQPPTASQPPISPPAV